MRLGKTALAGAVALLLAAWLALGILIWSRNRVPALSLPPRPALPAGNVYPEYVRLVPAVKDANTVLESMVYKREPTPQKRGEILRQNAGLFRQLRELAGKPSVVTELEPGVKFVAARDFPNVAQLVVWKAREQAAADPDAALHTLIDGLFFAEGVGRDGAFLHVTTAFTCYVPLFEALGETVSRASVKACADARARVQALVESQGGPEEIVRNERRARLRQFTSTFPDPMRGFKLQAFRNDYDWDYVMKPKAAVISEYDAFVRRWEQEAAKPFSAMAAPDPPSSSQGLLPGEAVSNSVYKTMLLRYFYKDARLRVLHAGLAARAAGLPPSLPGVVSEGLLKDPFTGGSIAYNRKVVYSAGPDGEDSGGAPVNDRGLQPGSRGDLVLRIAP